jgi:hypothetical protein
MINHNKFSEKELKRQDNQSLHARCLEESLTRLPAHQASEKSELPPSDLICVQNKIQETGSN